MSEILATELPSYTQPYLKRSPHTKYLIYILVSENEAGSLCSEFSINKLCPPLNIEISILLQISLINISAFRFPAFWKGRLPLFMSWLWFNTLLIQSLVWRWKPQINFHKILIPTCRFYHSQSIFYACVLKSQIKEEIASDIFKGGDLNWTYLKSWFQLCFWFPKKPDCFEITPYKIRSLMQFLSGCVITTKLSCRFINLVWKQIRMTNLACLEKLSYQNPLYHWNI